MRTCSLPYSPVRDDRPSIPPSVNLSHCSLEIHPAPGLRWVMEVRSRGWEGQAPITQHPLITVTGKNPCRMLVLAYRALGFNRHRAQELSFYDLDCFSGFPEHPEELEATRKTSRRQNQIEHLMWVAGVILALVFSIIGILWFLKGVVSIFQN